MLPLLSTVHTIAPPLHPLVAVLDRLLEYLVPPQQIGHEQEQLNPQALQEVTRQDRKVIATGKVIMLI